MDESLPSRSRGAALQQALLALDDYLARVEPGTLLPPERELARRFGVSRTTLRTATAELALRGRLEVRQGTGTLAALRQPPVTAHSPAADTTARAAGQASALSELLEIVAAQLARLAALRAGPDTVETVLNGPGTDAEFVAAVAACSGNVSAPALVRQLRASLKESRRSNAALLEAQERLLVDLRRSVASAIASGDGDAAEGAMSLYMATWRRLSRLV